MDCLSRMSILWGHADTEAYADFYMAYKNGFVMACDYFAPTVCWKYNLFIQFFCWRASCMEYFIGGCAIENGCFFLEVPKE